MATDSTDQIDDIVLDHEAATNNERACSPSASLDQAFKTMLRPLEEMVTKIADRLDGTRRVKSHDSLDGVFDWLEKLEQRQDTVTTDMANAVRRVDQLLDRLELDDEPQTATSRPAAAVPSPPTTDVPDRWERALLGDELCTNDSVVDDRRELMDGTLAGEANATGLVGRILLVQSASTNELPSLLKEIGEAYYRWRPKTVDVGDPMEQTLVEWLAKRIKQSGLRNSIALVRPGDRYESSRHNSTQKGIEVAEVCGWVVLRENGKALSRANVSLR